jgi:hypothetical protein
VKLTGTNRDGWTLSEWELSFAARRYWNKPGVAKDTLRAIEVIGQAPNVRWVARLPDGTKRESASAKREDAKRAADKALRELLGAQATKRWLAANAHKYMPEPGGDDR